MTQAAVDLEHYDPMERSTQQDPFPYYAALRQNAPVFRHPGTGLIFVSRMETVSHVLSRPDLFSSRFANAGSVPMGGGVIRELQEIASEGLPPVNTMLTADPPAQTRYRKSIGKAFSTRAIGALEPHIRALAVDIIEGWPDSGRIDFMTDFALALPVRVIAHALGMSLDREADIKRWSDDSVAALGAHISDARRLEAARGVVELQCYWLDEFARCRARPRGDIVSDLVNADFEDHTGELRKLDDAELASIVQQLMVAGNETTTKLFNEATRLLIENPPEWKRIQQDPSTVPAMVEEALRMSSPNQGLFRVVTADTELEGTPISKGSRLWIMFGSANRDESVFPDPDRFDPTRPNLREHVAFGKGAHFCIGAPLARLEARVGFEELARRIDRMHFAPGSVLEYEPSFILRGLAALDLVIEKKIPPER